jgi:hypothetical protein
MARLSAEDMTMLAKKPLTELAGDFKRECVIREACDRLLTVTFCVLSSVLNSCSVLWGDDG